VVRALKQLTSYGVSAVCVCVCVRARELVAAVYDRITKLATGVPRGPRLSTVQRRQYYSTHTRIYWNFTSLYLRTACSVIYYESAPHACMYAFPPISLRSKFPSYVLLLPRFGVI
jgi:hypothetical protein